MATTVADLMHLIEQEIPDGRRQLQDSHNNLSNVAAYCEANYAQAQDKHYALEETRNYTTQSLASVAYQINTMAANFLHLLDLQMTQMAEMESSINHLSQTVMIHKEKVARREIGVLTTNKTTSRPAGVKNPGIIFPEHQERPVKYVRKTIDYSILDDIGHGVKQQLQQQNPRGRRTSSSSIKSAAPSTAGGAGPAPATKPPTPPSHIYRATTAGGTLSRQTSSPYRSPAPPVSPPSVPSHYGPGNQSNYARQPPPAQVQHQPAAMIVPPGVQIQAGVAERRSGYAAVSNMSVPPPAPPMGKVPPMSQVQPPVRQPMPAEAFPQQQMPPPTPPPPPMPASQQILQQAPQQMPHMQKIDSPLPSPLPESAYQDPQTLGNVSPPLPPPPDHHGGSGEMTLPQHHNQASRQSAYADSQHDDYAMSLSMDQPGGRFSSIRPGEGEWVPKVYLEKVIAIYDYVKDKEDELTFSEGSTIYVVKKNDDGWWEGVMEGVTGLFPGNYVEPCI